MIARGTSPRHRLVILHALDPRGRKVGGIETHVRLVLEHHPEDFSLAIAGYDGQGDLAPGEPTRLDIGRNGVDFLPLFQARADTSEAAAAIGQSMTLRYLMGAARHRGPLARLGGGPATADLHRVEFALLPRLLGWPFALMIHSEPSDAGRTDSLLERYPFVQRASRRTALALAHHVFCVSPNVLERVGADAPSLAARAEVMSVPVDTGVFRPEPFDTGDGVLRIAFAGRLDRVKDPGLMFRTIALLAQALQGRVEWHYAGTSDPGRYPEFAAIAPFTVRHGFQGPDGLRRLYAKAHLGLLTSHSEGMPCLLLEMMAAGRPFAAIRLPQYDPLIVPGRSGRLVLRRASTDESAEALGAATLDLWRDIREGRSDPRAIGALVEPYSVKSQLARLFDRHRAMAEAAAAAA